MKQKVIEPVLGICLLAMVVMAVKIWEYSCDGER